MHISAFFFGDPDGPLDKACCSIFEEHGGKLVSAGTMLVGPAAGERDVQYDVPAGEAFKVKAALKKAGFRLEPTPFSPDDMTGGIADTA